MQLLSVGLLLLLLAGAAGYAFWVYHRREPRVPGGRVLALLRAAALILILLLLWNPQIPAGDVPGGRPSVVLLDRSLSMAARGVGGTDAWSGAVARAEALEAGGARILTFGGAGGEAPGIPGGPDGMETRLVPVLERAVELGAREVTVVSDLRLADPEAAARAVRTLGVDLTVEAQGQPVLNAGIATFELPPFAARADTLTAQIAVFGERPGATGAPEASPADSVTLEVREGDRLVASQPVQLPPPGRTAALSVVLPPPSASGPVVYAARIFLEDDGFPDDNERLQMVDVDADAGGLVLLSLRPDWEPRFLLPLLRDVTGLPTRGYLSLGAGRYLAMDPGTVDDPSADQPTVQEAVERADVLVLHGFDGESPQWIQEAAADAPRLIVFPTDPDAAAVVGVETVGLSPGEWIVTPELPSSPLGAELAGAPFTGLPPVGPLLVAGPPSGSDAPLLGQLQGRGVPEPLLELLESEGQRRAVVLAQGFWRWGFRAGTSREVYRRLWAGVGGWVLTGSGVAGGPGVRLPVPLLERGAIPEWTAATRGGESLRLVVREDGVPDAADGPAVLDSLMTVSTEGRIRGRPLPPGRYRWQASGGEGGAELLGEGPVVVEGWTGELIPLPVDLAAAVLAADTIEGVEGGPGGGRPLRTHPLPFILLLGVLCVEWIGRRRRGLR